MEFTGEQMIKNFQSLTGNKQKQQKVYYDNLHQLTNSFNLSFNKSNMNIATFNIFQFQIWTDGQIHFNPILTFNFLLELLDNGINFLCLQEFLFCENNRYQSGKIYNNYELTKEETKMLRDSYTNFINQLNSRGYILIENKVKSSNIGNVIIYPLKYKIVKMVQIDSLLPDSERHIECRGALILKLRNMSEFLTICLTHLTDNLGTYQKRMISKIINHPLMNEDNPTILTGDMNVPNQFILSLDVIKYIEESKNKYWIDSTGFYQELLDKGYKTIKRGSKNKPTCWNNTDVDYIGIRNKNIKEIKVYFPIDNDKNIISDHCIKVLSF